MSDANHKVGKLCSRYGCPRVSIVDTEMGAMCRDHFSPLMISIVKVCYPDEDIRVLNRIPDLVPLEFMKPHENQCRYNHGHQTLARISERGGFSVREALAILQDLEYGAHTNTSLESAVIQFLRIWDGWKASGEANGVGR